MFSIGLDLRALRPGFKAHFGRGIGRYAAELSRRLLSDSVPPNERITLAEIPPTAFDASPIQSAVLKAAPFGRTTLSTQLFLPRRLAKLPFSMLHFMAHADAPAYCPKPYIVTALDLIPLRFPQLYKPTRASWRFRLARELEFRSLRQAAGICTISECTKRDLIELLCIPEEKIYVTPLGVDASFLSETQTSGHIKRNELRIKLLGGLPSDTPLLLYVGGIDPRKNISFALRVLAELCKELQPAPILLLAGAYSEDAAFPVLKDQIKASKLTAQVRLLGYVSDEELCELYAASDLFLFPSLYEGFGLPVLEAMARGVPVVAGRNSSIVEVADGAAVLLADNELELWVKEIMSLLSSSRIELIAAGFERAKQFSWERTARTTLAAYENVTGCIQQP